jgi:hypothetical protein
MNCHIGGFFTVYRGFGAEKLKNILTVLLLMYIIYPVSCASGGYCWFSSVGRAAHS